MFAAKQLICMTHGKNGGLPGPHYTGSTSGWFEMQTFRNWFETVVLPYWKSLEGKKIMIVDNLSCISLLK